MRAVLVLLAAGICSSVTIEPSSRVILLRIPDEEAAGQRALLAWSSYAQAAGAGLPPVWVLCPTPAAEASVRESAPGLHPLAAPDSPSSSSWSHFLESFMVRQGATVLGLFGEGSYPPPGLPRSIQAMGPALDHPHTPVAVVPRSQRVLPGAEDGAGRRAGDARWLPDTFIAQAWITKATLSTGPAVTASVLDASILRALPLIVGHLPSKPSDVGGVGSAIGVLVDGTNVVASRFWGDEEVAAAALPVARDCSGDKLYIGALRLALVYPEEEGIGVGEQEEERAGAAELVRAPWPPR